MTPAPTPEVLCAKSWWVGCQGTGFLPRVPSWETLGFVLVILVLVAAVVFLVRYRRIRREMGE